MACHMRPQAQGQIQLGIEKWGGGGGGGAFSCNRSLVGSGEFVAFSCSEAA